MSLEAFLAPKSICQSLKQQSSADLADSADVHFPRPFSLNVQFFHAEASMRPPCRFVVQPKWSVQELCENIASIQRCQVSSISLFVLNDGETIKVPKLRAKYSSLLFADECAVFCFVLAVDLDTGVVLQAASDERVLFDDAEAELLLAVSQCESKQARHS